MADLSKQDQKKLVRLIYGEMRQRREALAEQKAKEAQQPDSQPPQTSRLSKAHRQR